MGRSIAYALISHDILVVLHDKYPEAVYRSVEFIESMLKKGIRRDMFTPEEAAQKESLLTIEWGDRLDAFSDVDFVIEAVSEDIAIKKAAYHDVLDYIDRETTIVTNTSSIQLDTLAKMVTNPSRFCNLHFFNPVHTMQLVEIAGHDDTDPATLAKALALAKAIKKTPVVLQKDCPGLIVNRILFYNISMALQSVLEGRVSPDQLDRAFENMGMEMGPFETLDLVGFDVSNEVLRTMSSYYLKEKYDYSLFTNIIDRGDTLGKKTGKGFYLYKKGRKQGINKNLLNEIAPDGISSDPKVAKQIAETIYYRMIQEAETMVAEGICEARFLDLACILGAGITPNRGGLLGIK